MITVLQHDRAETPGRLGATLRDHGFKLDIRHLYEGGRGATNDPKHGVPPDLDNVHGVVVMGGAQNITQTDIDSKPWMKPEIEFVRAAHEAELPVIGVCAGAQLIAHALGGEVKQMERPFAGFTPVNLTVPGQTDTLMAGVPWTSPQFSIHAWEVTKLPEGATLLGSSEHCQNQVWRAGIRTVAFQYHFECDRPLVEGILGASPGLLAKTGRSAADVLAEADKHYQMYARVGSRQCVNLATFLFPMLDKLSA
jgi:GMP synthase (glutamine-hydrolysing)